MDAKSKANFINSVANSQNVPCPKCNALNEVNAKFCEFCGTLINRKEERNSTPYSLKPPKEYKEPESAFAEGLPLWDIEPPLMMVRRKRK